MAGEASVEVNVVPRVDPADLARIGANLGNSVEDGTAAGAKRAAAALQRIVTPATRNLGEEIQKSLSGAGTGVDKSTAAFKRFGDGLSATGRDTINLVQQLKELGTGLTAVASAIDRERSALNRSSIEQNTGLQRASNERVATLRNEGKLAAIEAQRSGQIQLREARTSGQQRVQITRSVLETIGRLEKGLGTTLSGIARTSVGAVSKVFDGLTSVFRRGDKEVFNSSTFTSALKERESQMRSSFSRQSSIVRESITRQEAAMVSLRESTQRGVLGAASNAGLLGGLGAGFALFQGLKSTFTVGADFTRGLSVLQASLDLTADQMTNVRQVSIDLGNDISLPGVSALDAAQAIQVLTKQFGSLGPAAVEAATAAAKGTLQLARASGASAEDAGALIGSAVNVFGVAATDAVSAADKIAGALTRAAGVSFTDFKDSFVQGATVFQSFVGPTESANDALLDFNTTLAVLAKNGITGSNAGAGLKQFFIQATQNTKSASKASAELASRAGETGNVFFQANGKLRPFNESVEILRKGVKGLSDQARTNVLGDLFGARSITIANALVKDGAESFATLREQIAKQGLAAKIAAAQNTGLKGALDALSSVVETVQIIFFEKVNKPLGNAVLAITNFANTVLFAATPSMHNLRIALLGVATGLGALLAMKTAVEVISLLGKAASLALTPMGGLALLFAGVGAAAFLFADRGKGIAATFDDIKTRIAGFASDLADRAQPVIATISDFIQGTAIPTIQRWAGVVARDLVGAFHATVNFIQGTVIPVVQRVVGVIVDDVVPRIVAVAQIVSNALVTAKDAVVDVAQAIGRTVGPLIEPAVTGFQRLGGAIADFVTGGGIGALGSGFAAAGAGIGAAFANIGQAILPSLRTLGSNVLAELKDIFSVSHLITAVNAIGDVLNFLGEQLALIVTNPKVLAAAGIIVGVAAKLAFDLATGILSGLAQNLPRLLADVWQLAVKFAFKPEIIIAALGALALGVGVIAPLVRSFTAMGGAGASGFVSGFRDKLSTGTSFLSGAFGKPGNSIFGPISADADAFGRKFQDLTNLARALGSTKLYEPTAAGLRELNTDVNNMKRGLSDAQIKGLEFRDRLGVAFRAISTTITGAGGIIGGIAEIPLAFGRAGIAALQAFGQNVSITGSRLIADFFGGEPAVVGEGTNVGATFGSALRSGLVQAKNSIVGGFRTIADGLRTASQESGQSIGSIIGVGLVKALGAAVSGIAFGKMIGNATSGTDQLLGVAGLVGSAAALGPIAGSAAVGIGLLTAAWTRSHNAADAYAADVKRIAEELSPKLVKAIQDGKLSIDQLRDGLTFGEIDQSGASDAVKSIIDTLNPASLKTLQQFGQISFADAFSGLIDSGKPVKEVTADIRSQMLDLLTTSAAFKSKFGADTADVAKFLRDVAKPGGPATFEDAAFKGGTPAGVLKNEDAIKQLLGLINDTTGAINKNGDALDDAAAKAIAYGTTTSTAAQQFGQAVLDANVTGALDATGAAMDNAKAKAQQLGSQLGLSFASADSARTGAIDDVNTKLQKVVDIKTQIDSLFGGGILPAGVTGTQAAIDQALISVDGLGKRLQEIQDNADITPQLKSAQTETALAAFSKDIGAALSAGIKDGTVIDAATAASVLQPIVDQAKSSTTSQAIKDGLQAAFDHIITTFSPTIDQATAATQAQSYLDTIKSILENAPPISVPVAVQIPKTLSTADATFATDVLNAAGIQAVQVKAEIATPVLSANWAGEAQALVDGASPAIPSPVVPTVTVPAGYDAPALSAANTTGQAISTGMASGIRNNSGVVSNAARTVASNAVQAAKAELGIASPSKAFRIIGGFAATGLAQGIEAGGAAVATAGGILAAATATGVAVRLAPALAAVAAAAGDRAGEDFTNLGQLMMHRMRVGILESGDDMVTSVKNTVQKAIDAATGQVSDASKALRSGTTGLFDAMFGSGSVAGKRDFGGLQGSITSSFNSLASTLDDSFGKAKDILDKSTKEKLSRSELDILGEQGNSLNPNDVLGAANRGALASTLDSIVELGKSMIEQGVPAQQVTQTLQGYIDRTKALAVSYGLGADQVDALVGSLGLGKDALKGFVDASVDLATTLGQVKDSAKKLNDQVVDLFKAVTGGDPFKSITGVGAAEDSRAAVTSALNGIAAAADANDARAAQIIGKIQDPAKNGNLTFSDQLAFNQGLNGRSINTTDQFGIANRTAFEGAIQAIGKMGTALLEGGSSAAYVTQQINEQVDALVAYGTSLGFNSDQIRDLVDKAGLGQASLDGFNRSVESAGKVAQQAAEAAAPNAPSVPNGDLPPISNTPTDAQIVDTLPNVTINQYLPYADPAAIALAAQNGVAGAVRLPV